MLVGMNKIIVRVLVPNSTKRLSDNCFYLSINGNGRINEGNVLTSLYGNAERHICRTALNIGGNFIETNDALNNPLFFRRTLE